MCKKEAKEFQKLEEKLILALGKPSKEFIDDFLIIFAFYADFTYPQHEHICRNPYFTYEDGAGFYSSGISEDEIVLGHEFTTALYAWGLWGESLVDFEEPTFPLKGKDLIRAKEWTLFRKAGIRLCECALDLFPQCEAVLTDDDERIKEGNGWKYLEIVRSPNGGFEHIHISDEEYMARWR